jgi:predicted aspartyl protease
MDVRPSATVAFRVADQSRPLILLPVLVSGEGPYTFVLDTGASLTMVAEKLSSALGLPAGAEADGVGAGGMLPVSICTLDELAIAGERLHDVEVAVGDLSAVEAAAGVESDGVLGYNVLSLFAVTIDYGPQP